MATNYKLTYQPEFLSDWNKKHNYSFPLPVDAKSHKKKKRKKKKEKWPGKHSRWWPSVLSNIFDQLNLWFVFCGTHMYWLNISV